MPSAAERRATETDASAAGADSIAASAQNPSPVLFREGRGLWMHSRPALQGIGTSTSSKRVHSAPRRPSLAVPSARSVAREGWLGERAAAQVSLTLRLEPVTHLAVPLASAVQSVTSEPLMGSNEVSEGQ